MDILFNIQIEGKVFLLLGGPQLYMNLSVTVCPIIVHFSPPSLVRFSVYPTYTFLPPTLCVSPSHPGDWDTLTLDTGTTGHLGKGTLEQRKTGTEGQ